MHAINFLTAVARSVHFKLFEGADTLRSICESIVIPNLRMREDMVRASRAAPWGASHRLGCAPASSSPARLGGPRGMVLKAGFGLGDRLLFQMGQCSSHGMAVALHILLVTGRRAHWASPAPHTGGDV